MAVAAYQARQCRSPRGQKKKVFNSNMEVEESFYELIAYVDHKVKKKGLELNNKEDSDLLGLAQQAGQDHIGWGIGG